MIFKLVSIAIVGVLLVTLLKSAKPEFAVLAALGTGVVLAVFLLNSLSGAVLAFDSLVEKSGVSGELFSIVLKIVGIGYVTEYSSSLSEDAGCSGIAQKIQLGGKLTIFLMSLSVIEALISTVSQIAGLIK